MKKAFCLLTSFIVLLCSACKNTETSFTATEAHQENIQVQEESPSVQDKLTYSNLDSNASTQEVRSLLTEAGIQPEHVDNLTDDVAQ